MAREHPGQDPRGGAAVLNHGALVATFRAWVEQAASWCPDASPDDRTKAATRLAWEALHRVGLSRDTLPPEGLPSLGERELLEAATDLMARPKAMPREDSDLEPTHPSGFGLGPEDLTCGQCAWLEANRCLQMRRPRSRRPFLADATPACHRWEARLSGDDCGVCGACCREGYSCAPVRRGEAVRKLHPGWLETDSDGFCRIPRPGGRCVALVGDGVSAPWRCVDYPARPRACSGLEPSSLACLEARRRAGLSR